MKAIFLTRSKFCRRAGIALVVCGMIAMAGWIALRFVPLPPALVNGQSPELEFVDRNGEPLRSVRAAELPFERTVSYR